MRNAGFHLKKCRIDLYASWQGLILLLVQHTKYGSYKKFFQSKSKRPARLETETPGINNNRYGKKLNGIWFIIMKNLNRTYFCLRRGISLFQKFFGHSKSFVWLFKSNTNLSIPEFRWSSNGSFLIKGTKNKKVV